MQTRCSSALLALRRMRVMKCSEAACAHRGSRRATLQGSVQVSWSLPWLARCELEETGTSGSSSETPSQVTVSALANFLTGRIVSTPLSLRMLVHHTEGARETKNRDRARGTRDPARSASPPDRGPENVPAYYRLPRVSKNYRLTYFTIETTQRAKNFATRDLTSTFTSVLAAKSTFFGWPSLRQDQVAPDFSPAQLVLGA